MKKKLIHLTLALLLAFNAVLPAYASISIISHNLEQAQIAEFYGVDAKILICTADGFKYVSVADIQSGKVSQDSNKLHCKLCLASIAQDKAHDSELADLTAHVQKITRERLPLIAVDSFPQEVKEQNHSRAPPKISS